jgi:hypothetical protein
LLREAWGESLTQELLREQQMLPPRRIDPTVSGLGWRSAKRQRSI